MLAFLPSLGWQEMFLLIVIGLLLYGRNLPQAGRSFGRIVAQLKRGFEDFKAQLDRDESLREVRRTLEETTREVRNVTAAPRAIVDPGRALREFADETIAAPADDVVDEPAPPPPPPTTPGPLPPAAPTSGSQTNPGGQ